MSAGNHALFHVDDRSDVLAIQCRREKLGLWPLMIWNCRASRAVPEFGNASKGNVMRDAPSSAKSTNEGGARNVLGFTCLPAMIRLTGAAVYSQNIAEKTIGIGAMRRMRR